LGKSCDNQCHRTFDFIKTTPLIVDDNNITRGEGIDSQRV